MFEKILDDSIELIENKIKTCNDTNIQNQLKVIYGRLPDGISKKDILDDIAFNFLRFAVINSIPNEELDEAFKFHLNRFTSHTKKLCTYITLKIDLIEHENEVNRTIKIPYGYTMGDLAYVIQAAFQIGDIFGYTFVPELDELPYLVDKEADPKKYNDAYLGHEVNIGDISSEKLDGYVVYFGNKISKKNPYKFKINLVGIEVGDKFVPFDSAEILKGTGSNVCADLFKDFDKYTKEHPFVLKDFNEDLNYDLLDIKELYEQNFDVDEDTSEMH